MSGEPLRRRPPLLAHAPGIFNHSLHLLKALRNTQHVPCYPDLDARRRDSRTSCPSRATPTCLTCIAGLKFSPRKTTRPSASTLMCTTCTSPQGLCHVFRNTITFTTTHQKLQVEPHMDQALTNSLGCRKAVASFREMLLPEYVLMRITLHAFTHHRTRECS